jgi:hypothetical protein
MSDVPLRDVDEILDARQVEAFDSVTGLFEYSGHLKNTQA